MLKGLYLLHHEPQTGEMLIDADISVSSTPLVYIQSVESPGVDKRVWQEACLARI